MAGRCRRDAALAVESGAVSAEHLLSCRRCRAVADAHRHLGRQLSDLGGNHRPRPYWTSRVWAAIDSQEHGQRRHRGRYFLHSLTAALSAALILFSVWTSRLMPSSAAVSEVDASEINRRVDHALAQVELVEAKSDLEIQLIHVAYAERRAHSATATPEDRELLRQRQVALDSLRRTHRSALLQARSTL